jgi:hypothetical protein
VGRKEYSVLATAVAAGLPETLVEVLATPEAAAPGAAAPLDEASLPEPPQPASTAEMVSNPNERPKRPQFRSKFMFNRLANR